MDAVADNAERRGGNPAEMTLSLVGSVTGDGTCRYTSTTRKAKMHRKIIDQTCISDLFDLSYEDNFKGSLSEEELNDMPVQMHHMASFFYYTGVGAALREIDEGREGELREDMNLLTTAATKAALVGYHTSPNGVCPFLMGAVMINVGKQISVAHAAKPGADIPIRDGDTEETIGDPEEDTEPEADDPTTEGEPEKNPRKRLAEAVLRALFGAEFKLK